MRSSRAHSSLNLILAISFVLTTFVEPVPRPVAGQDDFIPHYEFLYDANGNVETRTDANGAVTTYDYDAMDRLVAINYPDNTSVTYTYNNLGLRTRMTDSLGTMFYEYDIHDRLISVTDPNGYTIQYAYDPRGLISRLIYPDGSVVSYTWDESGQLAAIHDPDVGETRYEYDEAGKLIQRTLANSVTTDYEYDDANRLEVIRHTDPGGTLLLEFEYEYDAANNRTRMTRTEADGSPQLTGYEYDELSRLVSVAYPNGEKVTYTYNQTGNRTTMTSSKEGLTVYTYNDLGQLVELEGRQGAESFRYDANGNLIERLDSTGRTISYAWDYENRLIGVVDGDMEVAFGYDGDGRRLTKTVNGRMTRYVQHGYVIPQVLFEITDSETRRLFPSLPQIGDVSARGNQFYLEDGLGSVVGVTNNTASLVGILTYDAFGTLRGPTNLVTTLSFAGEQSDAETSLIFLRARFYDPALGRFLSRDPVQGSMSTPQSLNPYIYAINNPVNLIDPRGEAVVVTAFGIYLLVVGIVGAVSEAVATYGLLQQSPNLFQTGPDWLHVVLGASRGLGSSVLIGLGVKHLKWLEGGVSGGLSQAANELIFAAGYGQFRDDAFTSIGVSTVANTIAPTRRFFISNLRPFVTGSNSILRLAAYSAVISQPLAATLNYVVGGVSLDRTAEVLINLNDITGATYDTKTSQLVFIGRKESGDLSLPPLNMDDVVVAIRAVYSGESPAVTIVPVDPSFEDSTQRVEYFGQTENTHFGLVMFEADRYLKSLAAGKDTFTSEPMAPDVEGFKSELQLSMEMRTDVPFHRNWFLPGEIILKETKDGNGMIFDEATIILESRFIQFQPDGTHVDVLGSSPVTDVFTAFITEHYDEFAKEKEELAQLIQLAKIVGVVKWLQENDIPVDLSWMANYEVAYMETPLTTPGVINSVSTPDGTYTITLMGGVDFSRPITIEDDASDEADDFQEQALTSRPADIPVSWEFEKDGEIYTAVALDLAPREIRGGYTHTVTNLTIPLNGGLTAEFTRTYNSLNLSSNTMGPGWSFLPYHLYVQEIYKPSEEAGSYTVELQAALQSHGQREVFIGPYTNGSGEQFLLPDGDLSGVRNILLNENGYVLREASGRRVYFDLNGQLHVVEDASGNQLHYTYDDHGRLAAIVDISSRGIQLAYNAAGQLTAVTATNGQATHYNYDAGGYLIGASDETGTTLDRYDYDVNGRLVRITDSTGRVLVENAYDELGRVIQSGPTGYAVNVIYDNQSNESLYTDAAGNTFSRQYDDQNRLVMETDPLGGTITYEYNENGRLSKVTDRNGNETQFSYDALGFLNEVVSPLGDMTRLVSNELGSPEIVIDPAGQITFFEYNEQGRLVSVQTGFGLGELSSDGSFNYFAVDPNTISYEYDSAGRLAAVTDSSSASLRFSYDGSGNLTHIQLPGGGQKVRTFDAASRLTTIADPLGYQVEFSYDTQGQLLSVTTPAGTTSYTYTNGLLTAVTDPLNNTIQYAYSPLGLLTTVTEPGGTVTNYEYDSVGNLVAVVDALGSRVEYEHDAVGRLISETRLATYGIRESIPPNNETGITDSDRLSPESEIAKLLSRSNWGLISLIVAFTLLTIVTIAVILSRYNR